MSNRVRTTILPVIAAFIWGVAFVAQKGNTVGPLLFNASRGIVAFLFLLVVIAVMTKGDLRHLLVGSTKAETRAIWLGGLCCGAALAFATFLQQYGLDGETEAGKASFLTAMYIVLVPLLGIFMHKKTGLRTWVAVALAVVGLYLLCVKEGSAIRFDDLIVLSCSLVFSGHILLIDHFSPQCNGVKMSAVQFLFVFVFSFAASLFLEQNNMADLGNSIVPILYLGIFSSGVAYTLQIVAQRDADPAVLSLLLSLESVFGVLAGAVVLGEVLSMREYLGCIVMFTAVVVAQLPGKKQVG